MVRFVPHMMELLVILRTQTTKSAHFLYKVLNLIEEMSRFCQIHFPTRPRKSLTVNLAYDSLELRLYAIYILYLFMPIKLSALQNMPMVLCIIRASLHRSCDTGSLVIIYRHPLRKILILLAIIDQYQLYKVSNCYRQNIVGPLIGLQCIFAELVSKIV